MLAFIIYLSRFDLFSLSNFSNFSLMVNLDISSLGTPWKNYVRLYKLSVIKRIAYFKNISMAASVSLGSRIWESSPKLSRILATTKPYKKTFLMKQLLSSTNSRFRTQTLKSSQTSCFEIQGNIHVKVFSQKFNSSLSPGFVRQNNIKL